MSMWATDAKTWKKLKEYVRSMRKEPTLAEKILWHNLRNRQLNGIKFRRQFAISTYIVDFYNHQYSIIIELDGMSHDETMDMIKSDKII